MKLGEIEVHELIRALGQERSAWIEATRTEDQRRRSDIEKTVEKTTISVLAALEHALTALLCERV